MAVDVPSGFRFPAEWERHKQTWIGWPERLDNWRDNAVPAQNTFEEVIRTIAEFEPVTVIVSANSWTQVRERFKDNHNVRVIEMSTDDCWLRDTGPIFIVSRTGESSCQLCGVDFVFNAWGGVKEGCYVNWDKDAMIAWKILELERFKRYVSNLVLEGGAVSTDGQGTLLATEECVLHSNRNPNWSRDMIEKELKLYLGVEKIIWLPLGVYGDHDTNGHVDNLCVFVGPGKVVIHWTEDKEDPQYERSLRAFQILETSRDAKGRSLSIHKLPVPGPFYRTELEASGVISTSQAVDRKVNERLVASYVNFYFANNVLIMPSFGEPWDSEARKIFQSIVPERQIRQVAAREIILGGGGIHCVTQQQPEDA
ncbi:agmatine deiminase [Galdieria sulphuraria]|uniref:Agmatine deiminase n=1 Tax=Galdieria sulphuraria TaxID=130081 RepID=M2XJV7_GALSU|nr:agmatine deiminase [Galdieria sulphuraria]EME30397.1 agmatine deiminase [Galdieria sulphuraria]|eukprot:XP_005706917.1 agmatine deiminase [Galdieria sulphuraria]